MTESIGSSASVGSRIAFLGMGKMGLPMASRLVSAGCQVVGYDPLTSAREAFVETGGSSAATAAEAAERANVLTTMLPDGKAVWNALFGAEGIADPCPRSNRH